MELTEKQKAYNAKCKIWHEQLVEHLTSLVAELGEDSFYTRKLLDYVIENNVIKLHFDGEASGEKRSELIYKSFLGEIPSVELDRENY